LPNPRATVRNAPTAGPRTESQTDQAYDVLEEQIVTLRLEPGAVLSENRLADALGFGRTPIREALQRLARESLVAILPRKGILVAEITPRKQLLALEDISFMRLDHELNFLVSKAAHNEYATRAIGLLHGMSRRFWYMHYKEAADLPLCARLHAQLARRIAAGEPEEAARASDQLVDYAETFTRATVGAGAMSVRGQRIP
jgi:DNA-binding GntR family transcriptional regulator